MTSIKLILNELLADTASRANGAIFRKMILENLQNHDFVEVDFSQVNLTPSFTDEAFGLLCHDLTIKSLTEKVKFLNLSPTHKALLTRVIANRFTSPAP